MQNEKNFIAAFTYSVFKPDGTGIIVTVYDLPETVAKNWVKNYFVPTFHPELIGYDIYLLN